MINRLGGFENIAQDEVRRHTTTQSLEARIWAGKIARAAVVRSIGVHKSYIASELKRLAVEMQSKRCGATVKAILLSLARDFE